VEAKTSTNVVHLMGNKHGYILLATSIGFILLAASIGYGGSMSGR